MLFSLLNRPCLNRVWCAAALSGALAITSHAAIAQDAKPIAGGKYITMIISYGTGGGYDIYGRLVARHLGDHLPGTPKVIVKNMPGAGGLSGANFLYNVAAKDGSDIGVINQNAALGQLLDSQSVKYDARAFTWIGRATSNVEIFYAWHTAKINSIADARNQQIIAGGTGPTSSSEVMPRIMNQLLGTKFKVVAGYVDGGAVTLALERGEVEAYVTPWAVLKSSKAAWIKEKKIKILAQLSLERHPDLPDVPTLLDLAKNEDDRRVFALFASGSAIGRSIMAPPKLPSDVTATLRGAFAETMKDPRLIEEAKKSNLELDSATGEHLQEIIDRIFDVSPEVVAKAAALSK